MAREARKKSETGIYHVMLRGINHQDIFNDNEDKKRFLDILLKVVQLSGAVIYGFCLMGNHIHLLFKEGNEAISTLMKRLGTGYAGWYNWKYERSGHLFQDRYKSEPVENESYLLTVIRYIHNNPVKAGFVTKPEEWKWSSCNEYYNYAVYPKGIADTSFILKMFSDNKQEAAESFRKFMETECNDKCLEINIKKRKSDFEVMEEIKRLIDSQRVHGLMSLPKKERDALLRLLKQEEGITCRQIARVLGISVSLVLKA